MNSVREQSILAVRIAKFGPLRGPIRMLLFTLDQFSHIIKGEKAGSQERKQLKTDCAQHSSNKCKNKLLNNYSWHGNVLNTV